MFLYCLCSVLGDCIDVVASFEIWDWDKLDVGEHEDCEFDDCRFDDNEERDELEVRICKFVCGFIRECCLRLCLGCSEISKVS